MTDDVEDEYDALNDETFGQATADGDFPPIKFYWFKMFDIILLISLLIYLCHVDFYDWYSIFDFIV